MMFNKRSLFFIGICSFILTGSSYKSKPSFIENPVSWSYRVEILHPEQMVVITNYALHIIANIKDGWHVFSQIQPKNAICSPTSFKLTPLNGIKLIGKMDEIGEVKIYKDTVTDISARQYENKVEFIQQFSSTSPIPDNQKIMSAVIHFQTCTEEQCMQPKNIQLDIQMKKEVD